MRPLNSVRPLAGIVLSVLLMSSAFASDVSLTFIGQQVIPHKFIYQDTTVGGLSALDYDPETNLYVAICDDRSTLNPARFYGLELDFDQSGFYGWKVIKVQFMKQMDGSEFPKPDFSGRTYVDPEALRFSPSSKSYFWTSEGHAKYGVNPFIREMTLDGSYVRDFSLPEKYTVADQKGIRDNMAFEALTVTLDQKSILVATEGPLKQDGEVADVSHGADIRLLQLDIETGKRSHEYVYSLDPVHEERLPMGNFSINGVVDILAVNAQQLLVLERSFAVGAGLSIRLYLADLAAATDVADLDSLKGAKYQAMTKKLLLDLGELGIAIDNIEGMSFGKTLKDGRRSLVMISDDNFRTAQVTQILAFAIGGVKP